MTILTSLLLLIFLKGCLSAPADQKRVLFGGPGGIQSGSLSTEFNKSSSGSMGSFGPSNFVPPTGFVVGGFFSGFNPFLHISGEIGGAVNTNGGGHQMCMPISQTCPMKCPNGYTTNPMGCEECHCKATHTEHTTQESKATGHANTQLQHTTQASGATDHANTVTKDSATIAPIPVTTVDTTCQDAKTLCNLKCSGSGYLIDPNDCTYCVCKSDLLTPNGR